MSDYINEYNKGTLPINLEREEEFEKVKQLNQYDRIEIDGKPYQFYSLYGHGNGWITSNYVVLIDDLGKHHNFSLREFNKLKFKKV